MKRQLNILFWFLTMPILTFGQTDDTLLQPKLILNDTSIINNTDLKVYLLFDIRDYFEVVNGLILLEYVDYVQICQNDFLTICFYDTKFKITPTGFYKFEEVDSICNAPKIKINKFGTNMDYKKLKNDDVKIIHKVGKKRFKSRFGKIVVNRQTGCMDTGRNPLKILHNRKTLQFNDIGNLIFFEFDGDHDKKTELYIVNYFTCNGRLEIYKIDNK